MKVSVPVMDRSGMASTVGAHFGKVPAYAIYNTESGELNFLDNTSEHLGGVGMPPELLSKADVEVVLCSGLGPKAVDMLTSLKIQVHVGAKGTVQDTLDAWKAGKLPKANQDNACKEHSH
jgi:predicted Fe-Mo cluster-binding NifX family protein